MEDNSYIKSLEGFNPENLVFDESFASIIRRKTGFFPEARIESSRIREISVAGEITSLKTGGAIHSGCVILPDIYEREIYAAANIRGEIYFFEQGMNAVQAVSKVTLQGAIYVSPVFSGGILYCTTREGMIYAVETVRGDAEGVSGGLRNRIAWRRKMKKGIFAEPVISGSLLLVTTTEGVFAIDTLVKDEQGPATGLWAISINGTLSTPAVDKGMIFIGSEDKRLFGFDYSEGSPKKVWEYDLDAACRMKPCVLNASGTVVTVSVKGSVYSVDKMSGKNKWTFSVRSPVIGNIVSGMISGNEYVFFGSDDGLFYCFDQSGKKLWDFKTGGKIRSEPAVSGSRVFFGSEDGSIYGLDIISGREIFRHKTSGNIYGRPLPSGNRIFYGSTDGYIYSAVI
jgi:outer membrane protein assembly factor BamB